MPARGEMLPERTERAEKRVSALVRNSLGILLVGGGVAVLTIFVATGIDGTWTTLGQTLPDMSYGWRDLRPLARE